MPSEDTFLEVLHDHYKDSFEHLLDHRRLRDRLFLLLLLTMTAMLFQVFSPVDASQTISEAVSKRLGLTKSMDASFIASIVWFALLALAIRYFQSVVLVERQYDYIHKLEEVLNPYYGGEVFTREGKAYLSGYPLFSKWASMLYTIAFPILLATLVTIKIVCEAWQAPRLSVTLGFNFAVSLLVLVSVALYLISLHAPKKPQGGDPQTPPKKSQPTC